MIGRRCCIINIQLLLAAINVLLSLRSCCTTSAFVPSRIRPRHYALSSTSSNNIDGDKRYPNDDRIDIITSQIQQGLSTVITSCVIFTTILTSPINSEAIAMTENQQFVADVWFAVTAQFFDQTFNGLGEDGWRAKEREAIQKVADTGPDDDEIVTNAINEMLSTLDDPYTRFLPREKYETLTAYATGGSARGGGIGVQLLEDPRTKYVMVMATTPGSPAAISGVQVGDIISKVDGENMQGISADVVAAKCRGEVGGKVDIDFIHKSDSGKPGKETTEITLTRAKINPNPIEASTFQSPKGKQVGLLRVPSFSTETVSQLVDGLRSVSNNGKGVDAIVIDIRGNVGGYMPAGVDAANLFLPAQSHIIAEVGNAGSSIKTYDADGIGAEVGAETPIYILVDKRTASAAEIFAAALQDNKRALVIGKENTFGKGRIQNVQSLANGSGVAVTRARYVTPRGRDLHGIGIIPDKRPSECEAKDSAKSCLADVVDMY